MAVKFKVVELGNPQNENAPKKFYARSVSTGSIGLEELSDDISNASTVTLPDVYAVLQSLVRELPKNIAAGRIVRLGNLGSFRLGLSSKGSDTADEVTSRNVVRTRLIFTPGRQVRLYLDAIRFEKEAVANKETVVNP